MEKVNNILNTNIHIVKPQFQLKSGIKSIKKLIENIEILIKYGAKYNSDEVLNCVMRTFNNKVKKIFTNLGLVL